MVRAAELAPSDFAGLVLRAVGRETDLRSVRNLHTRLITVLDELIDPARRPVVVAAAAAAARREMFMTSGDAQRAWAELFARTATGPDDLDVVRALRSGTERVPGLAVDTRLRWALFAALVRAGAVGEADIEAELATDRTLTGAEFAAGARAALPTEQAKQWAWHRVVERDDLPNRTQDSIVGGAGNSEIGVGFVQPGQPELTTPYVQRYFEVVPELWRTRSPEIARNLITGLYPRLHASPAVLAMTDDLLAARDLAPPLRRLLSEERAETERLIRARARAGSWPTS
jgi:aminopeptidase N